MKLSSPEFENDERMPEKVGYTKENINPELHISEIPEETVTLVLIMDDPDAMEPAGKIWDHWVQYDIEPTKTKIEEGENPGTSGVTDFRDTGYGGPNPPDGEHTYIFRIYALDSELGLPKGASKEDVENAMEEYIIEEAELKGRYE